VKHYYSVEAFSEMDVSFPEHLVAIGRGMNVFTLTSDNIQGVLSKFASAGVQVHKVHTLDGTATFHDLLPGQPIPSQLNE
jgi:hypothetical protein